MDRSVINNLVDWIKDYVASANANGVVLGMSGGKDSLIVAKLCAMALGNDKVFGVIMPNGKMIDKNDAERTCKLLNIPYTTLDISQTYNSIMQNVQNVIPAEYVSSVTSINIAPRVRMSTLYALAGSLNYLVANTSNLSEATIGYCTKWGDNVGDFAPLADFTKTEVCEIGLMLNLPQELVNKIPSDGLTGKSDEDSLGFSYKELDDLIRKGKIGENYDKIMKKYNTSKHKRDGIEKFRYNANNFVKNSSDLENNKQF